MLSTYPAQVLSHQVGAHGPEEEDDSMAKLRELLGSDAWAPGGASAQAALAQASSLVAPALQPEPALSGRPPLHKGSPRPAKAAAVPAPADVARQAETHTERKAAAQPSSSADSSSQAEMLAEPASLEETSSHVDARRPTAMIAEPGSSGCAAFTETQMQEDQGITAGGRDAGTGLNAQGNKEAVSIPLSEEGKAEFVRNLTAEIAAAAQQAALGAVSSSVEVACCLSHSLFRCPFTFKHDSGASIHHSCAAYSVAIQGHPRPCRPCPQGFASAKSASSCQSACQLCLGGERLLACSQGTLLAVQVAGEAVKELPSWAGPDVIMAATMTKLDAIVAAASAQVHTCDGQHHRHARFSGVARLQPVRIP